ncbi:MAG TPA: hypothetical protein VJ770_20865 [Stellaceae bacterium]|nr:hypothetical protein [Stellaceae bacterium]
MADDDLPDLAARPGDDLSRSPSSRPSRLRTGLPTRFSTLAAGIAGWAAAAA